MLYTVIWQYITFDDEVHKVMGHPESFEGVTDEQSAAEEGRNLLLHDLGSEFHDKLKPLSIVEVNEEMCEAIAECSQIELGELLFVVIDDIPYWTDKSWWTPSL